MFAIPWDFTMREFLSDSEMEGKALEKEIHRNTDLKMKELMEGMEKRHNSLVSGLQEWSTNIMNLLSRHTGLTVDNGQNNFNQHPRRQTQQHFQPPQIPSVQPQQQAPPRNIPP